MFLRICVVIGVLLGAASSACAQESPLFARDMLLLTPTTQGIFALPKTRVTLEIPYASVVSPAHLTVIRQGDTVTLEAADTYGAPLSRFEMPLIAVLDTADGPVVVVAGWPQIVSAPVSGLWLVVFDAHGVYARPAERPQPGSGEDMVIYLGPLEHFSLDLVTFPPAADGSVTVRDVQYSAAPLRERAILARSGEGTLMTLPTAARDPRYADRFIPEDLGNPGGFMLLGAVETRGLSDLVRALAGNIPNDPDIPAPGVPETPIALRLPFDCAADWVVSWGYHHSTPQNRFAVDFAALAPGGTAGQGIYAAHAGTVHLKRVGAGESLIDTGIMARVVATDGVTSTVYGHLAEADTLALWGLAAEDLPPFTWVDVGDADPGKLIGIAGRTGYATGPHIHFALWSWDQSLYQPVPLGPLTEFERGAPVPHDLRSGCEHYHR